MSEYARICPLCEKGMNAEVCPVHEVPTIELSTLDEATDALEIGAEIEGRYRIKEVLGRGAMGTVYLAAQLSMDRDVALKTLLRRLLSDYNLVQRFYREAQAASKLDHPNIIQTYDFGIDRATKVPFIVMEYLEGEQLAELLTARGSLPEAEACAILTQVARALAEAHSKGIVHRDLKPENIRMRTLADGELQAKVLDFGIAKVLQGETNGGDKLTGTGMTLGTPPYMSPEQIEGGYVDTRADLYSLGCILHELLTGKLPYSSTQRRQIFMMHMNAELPKLPDTLVDGVPPSDGLRQLHTALLQKDRAKRPATAKVVARILGPLSRSQTIDVSSTLVEALAEMRSGVVKSIAETREFNVDPEARIITDSKPPSPVSPIDPTEAAAASHPVGVPLATGPALPGHHAPADMLRAASEKAATVVVTRKTLPLSLVAALVLIVGGATAAIVASSGGDDTKDTRAPTTSRADPEPKVASQDGQKKTLQPIIGEARPKAVVENDGRPSSKLTRIRLESVPANAIITENLTELGSAPLDVPFAPGVSERVLQVKLQGYVPKEIVLQADMAGTYTVTLSPIAKTPIDTTTKPDIGKRPDRKPGSKPATPPKKDGKKTYENEIW